MLGLSLVQVVFASGAVYLGAQVAMGFGRDVRGGLFHTVTGYSAREVGVFGAPSLITRITNDVQQVQLLVAMTCTMAVSAPLTIVDRGDPGAAPGRGPVGHPGGRDPHSGDPARIDRGPDGAVVPADAGPPRRHQPHLA